MQVRLEHHRRSTVQAAAAVLLACTLLPIALSGVVPGIAVAKVASTTQHSTLSTQHSALSHGVEGWVKDERTGLPVSGAVVTIRRAAAATLSTADGNGYFSLAMEKLLGTGGEPSGGSLAVSVIIDAPGYSSWRLDHATY